MVFLHVYTIKPGTIWPSWVVGYSPFIIAGPLGSVESESQRATTFHEKLGMECHHPNWRTPSFFRGVGIPPTRSLLKDFRLKTPWLMVASSIYGATLFVGYLRLSSSWFYHRFVTEMNDSQVCFLPEMTRYSNFFRWNHVFCSCVLTAM